MTSPEDRDLHRRRHEWELSRMAFGVVSPGFWSVAIARQLWRIRDAQVRRLEQIDPEQLGNANEFHKGGELRTTAGVDFGAFLDAVEKRTDLDNELVADAYFLLMALDHLLRYAPEYEKRTSDPRVRAAIRAFEKDYAQVSDLRNVIEHLEEYALGGGRYRQRYGAGEGEEPRFALAGPSPDDEVVVSFGELSVSLKAAGKAAQRLSLQLNAVWNDALGGKSLIEPS